MTPQNVINGFTIGADGLASAKPVANASYGMVRTQGRSTYGDSHFGHVSTDGPADRGGLRYCISSASLRFVHRDDMEAEGHDAYLAQVEKIK